MSMKRITISVPQEIAEKAQRAADAGLADSVSAYFAGLAAREPGWAAAEAVVSTMIEEAGGLTDSDQDWVKTVLRSSSAGPAA
jgi:hypothetical protein